MIRHLSIRLGLVIATLLLFFSVVSYVNVAHAAVDLKNPLKNACDAGVNDPNSNSAACTKDNSNPLSGSNGIINKAANLVLILVGVIAVLMIILGGWTYVMANGDMQKTKGAKDTIMYAVIGLVVAVAAKAIIGFVLQKL